MGRRTIEIVVNKLSAFGLLFLRDKSVSTEKLHSLLTLNSCVIYDYYVVIEQIIANRVNLNRNFPII